MQALNIERADGSRWKVTLRWLREHDAIAEPQGLEYEFEVLRLLERVGIFAPHPIYLDATGKHFGDRAIVLTFLPGKTNVAPKSVSPWTDQLASALHNLHSVKLERTDQSILKPADNRQRVQEIADEKYDDPLAVAVVSALRAHCDRIESLPPTLLYNDYWAGNTIWNRGRLTGIIDWTHARFGDSRNDVSECRGALVLDHDEGVANAFLADYERHVGRTLPDVWFFDLLRGVTAYMWHEFWLEGTLDLGIDLDPIAVKQRLRAFLLRALNQSKAFE